jgi:hypothetical protein
MKKMLISILVAIPSFNAMAHSGHGHYEGSTFQHYLASYAHLIPIAIAVMLAGFLAYQLVWKKSKN